MEKFKFLLQGRLGLQSVYSIFEQENAYSTKDRQKLEKVKKELDKGIKNLNPMIRNLQC